MKKMLGNYVSNDIFKHAQFKFEIRVTIGAFHVADRRLA